MTVATMTCESVSIAGDHAHDADQREHEKRRDRRAQARITKAIA